ncbi:hypothetical protein BGZ96_011395 [Linnemannia gamsii]|uniref:2,3-bisphosphoglycerate-dependent phosphoglycerate mutase n=1 Tax=Linnemannia gamsii TaxID=64522 RepID=A0ABQ7KFR0_9FUNG|nr:hypothetical protein BGZ96_011395 [Linnemannia gamsii]
MARNKFYNGAAAMKRRRQRWPPQIRAPPAIKAGQRIIIAAHGNSLRALIKYLEGISDQDILSMNIPNGVPLVYELDATLKPVSWAYLSAHEDLKQAPKTPTGHGQAA